MTVARSDNSLKTPLAQSLQRFAVKKATDAISRTGRSLPCSVVTVVSSGIVTVKFEVNAAPFTLPNVTVPINYPEYIRYPIQVGDKGEVISADARLGGLTGLGSGVADLSQPANLQALSFLWLGSTQWTTTDDAQALVLYGPDGVILRSTSGAAKVTVNQTNTTVTGPLVASGSFQVDGNLGYFGEGPVSKKTVTGALSAVSDSNAKAVLTSIINALTGYGLVTNGTT